MTCSARTGVLTARTASASRALIAAIGVWTIRSGAASAGGIWTGADYAHEARASAAATGAWPASSPRGTRHGMTGPTA
ncbi:MAG: hypothetical protein JJE50_11970 [Actinomycetales bacterium]|nr:hypothetical protein [Actinomycetales bacterium]